jgi:hypothetical protein
LIALCVVLICVCALLVAQLAKRGGALIQVQKDIRQYIEDPLNKGDPSIAAHSVASAYELAYDSTFFSKVGAHAADGLKYADLLAKSGYDNVAAVTDELSAVTPQQESLKAYIGKLKDDISTMEASWKTRAPA